MGTGFLNISSKNVTGDSRNPKYVNIAYCMPTVVVDNNNKWSCTPCSNKNVNQTGATYKNASGANIGELAQAAINPIVGVKDLLQGDWAQCTIGGGAKPLSYTGGNMPSVPNWNPYWSGNLDYTNNPAGVSSQWINLLAENGVLTTNGDPLNQSLTVGTVGGNYGEFWGQKVFPNSGNDCDLYATICNIQNKLAQFSSMISGNANKWVQANITKGGSCAGCQGDAAYYIMHSYQTLQTILSQYQGIYNKHAAVGGGCTKGLLEANYIANQNTLTQECLQLQAQEKSAAQALAEAPAQNAAAAQGAAEAAAAVTAATASSTPMSSTTIFAIVGGVIFIAIVGAIFLHMHKGEVTVTSPTSTK